MEWHHLKPRDPSLSPNHRSFFDSVIYLARILGPSISLGLGKGSFRLTSQTRVYPQNQRNQCRQEIWPLSLESKYPWPFPSSCNEWRSRLKSRFKEANLSHALSKLSGQGKREGSGGMGWTSLCSWQLEAERKGNLSGGLCVRMGRSQNHCEGWCFFWERDG